MKIPFYGVWLLIIAVIQSTIIGHIEILLLKPNLFLIFIIIVGLLRGREEAVAVGVVFGMMFDIITGRMIGLYAIMYMYIGFAAGSLKNTQSIKLGCLTAAIFVGFCSLLTDFFYCVLYAAVFENADAAYALIHIVLPSALYNTVVALAVYWPIKNSMKVIGGAYEDGIIRQNLIR